MAAFNTKDYARALTPLTRAAEAGHAGAQYNLGFLYLGGGRGVAQDEAQAIYWLRKAAAQGDEDALDMLDAIDSM